MFRPEELIFWGILGASMISLIFFENSIEEKNETLSFRKRVSLRRYWLFPFFLWVAVGIPNIDMWDQDSLWGVLSGEVFFVWICFSSCPVSFLRKEGTVLDIFFSFLFVLFGLFFLYHILAFIRVIPYPYLHFRFR